MGTIYLISHSKISEQAYIHDKSEGGNAFIRTMSRKGIGSALTENQQEKIDNPIIFKPLNGDPGHGYEATALIEVCDAKNLE